MTDHIIKEFNTIDPVSFKEIVVKKGKTLHLRPPLTSSTTFYCVHGACVLHVLNNALKIIDTTSLVSGETYNSPKNAKTFLIESLNTPDQDLKFLKITTRIN